MLHLFRLAAAAASVFVSVAAASAAITSAAAAAPSPVPLTSAFVSASGVFPALTASTDAGATVRSESGHGALMAWADRLWYVSYLSVANAGSGTGLFSIDANMVQTQVAFHNSTYANRLLIPALNSIVIGPYVIDTAGNVRVLEQLLHVRVGGMAEHISTPTSAYFLGMDGPLWDCDLVALNCTQLFDLVAELDIAKAAGEQPHFKAAHTMNGTLWVCSNTFEENDALGVQHGGRLATWNGDMASPWVIVARTAFTEVTGRHNFGKVVFALGWDDASVILSVLDNGDGGDNTYGALQTYRLPKASHAYDHLWTTEWPRIREVESERYLCDMHGTFFELPPLAWGGAVWGIKPIAQHLRMVPDFASFRGFLVLGGNQVSSIFDNNLVTGQSQSGLWFGKTDDLWSFGKPQGFGGPWLDDEVVAGVPSDAYLMTGYDKKSLHLSWGPDCFVSGGTISLDVDFVGNAGHVNSRSNIAPWSAMKTWNYTGFPDSLLDGAYSTHYSFDPGFSSHWVRFRSSASCGNVTAWLTYT